MGGWFLILCHMGGGGSPVVADPTSVGYFEAFDAFVPGMVAMQEFVPGLERFQAQEI